MIPLLELGDHELRLAHDRAPVAGRVAREEILGELLRDGRAAALRGVLQQHGLHRHASQRGDVDARMVAEADILRGDERRDDRRHLAAVEPDAQRRIGRKEVVVLHVGTVLHEERAEHLAVLGIDLRGEVAARILQLLERRQPSEETEAVSSSMNASSAKGRRPRPRSILSFCG